MPKTVKSILRKSKSPSPKSPKSTRKKRVTISTENNQEKLFERLFSNTEIPSLWTTPMERERAVMEKNKEDIEELGKEYVFSNYDNRNRTRKLHSQNILPKVNKELDVRRKIPRLAAYEARIKLNIKDDDLPGMTLRRSKSRYFAGSRRKLYRKN